jgi:hypothetical protein
MTSLNIKASEPDDAAAALEELRTYVPLSDTHPLYQVRDCRTCDQPAALELSGSRWRLSSSGMA